MNKICKNCGDVIRSFTRKIFCSGMCCEQYHSQIQSNRNKKEQVKTFCEKCKRNTEKNKISDTEEICIKCGKVTLYEKSNNNNAGNNSSVSDLESARGIHIFKEFKDNPKYNPYRVRTN